MSLQYRLCINLICNLLSHKLSFHTSEQQLFIFCMLPSCCTLFVDWFFPDIYWLIQEIETNYYQVKKSICPEFLLMLTYSHKTYNTAYDTVKPTDPFLNYCCHPLLFSSYTYICYIFLPQGFFSFSSGGVGLFWALLLSSNILTPLWLSLGSVVSSWNSIQITGVILK